MSSYNLTVDRSYIPAVLTQNKGVNGWVIYYSVRHPQTHEFVRKRIKLNRERVKFSRLSDFKLYALDIVNQINAKLAGGWSPLMESDNLRLYTRLEVVIDEYLDEKKRELRPDTMRSYNSFCKQFKEYLKASLPNIYASLFNRVHAITYMDKIYKERKLSARSYNNNLKQARALFAWAKEKCYIKENPFENIKLKKVEEKRRVLIPADYREKITEYVKEHDPHFLLVLQLVFNSLIRPKEIRGLQVKHLRLKDRCIFIPKEIAKNHKDRYAAITPEIINLIFELRPDLHSANEYLISKDWTIGKEQMTDNPFDKHWARVRKALNLPKEMQLYSLKDSGITEMLEAGIASVSVMKHAGHHDLSMTTIYANHADKELTEHILSKAPKF